jgi:hypothetical protein
LPNAANPLAGLFLKAASQLLDKHHGRDNGHARKVSGQSRMVWRNFEAELHGIGVAQRIQKKGVLCYSRALNP